MLKSWYQSISLFMACDEFCAIFNKIRNPIGFIINSNLSLVSGSLVGAGMPW